MFPELGERIVDVKQEGTAICDVGKHLRRHGQRIALSLANVPPGARLLSFMRATCGSEQWAKPPE